MKTVKTLEDIKCPMWCKCTEENFNFLRKIGAASWHRDYQSLCHEHNYLESDIFCFIDRTKTDYFVWSAYEDRQGEEFVIDCSSESTESIEFSVIKFGFLEPATFKVQIFKVYNTGKNIEYIGVVNDNIPAKWDEEGKCLNPGSGYSLFKEYNQKLYTKLNSEGFYPKQKFKVSWTEKMSLSLEDKGWRLATNDEIESFKNV